MANKKLLIIISILITCNTYCQNNTVKTGTIKVKKQGHFNKVIFDDVDYKLMAIDIYGNLIDSAILGYKIFTTVNGIFYKIENTGAYLNRDIQQIIERKDDDVKLLFKDIKVRDRNKEIITIPELRFVIPFKRYEY